MRRMDSTCEDKVWVDEARKLEGIRRDVDEAVGGGLNVLVVTHFESMLSVVGKKLRECSIEHRAFTPGDPVALCARSGGAAPAAVWLVLASHLRAGALVPAPQTEEVRLRVLAAEHHPLLARDEALVAALARLPCRSRTTFHTALTDALLSRFVGDGVRSLLEKLGHTEDECLSHPLIGAAIRGAQEKVGRHARGEMPTLSAEEWFKYNMGPTT